MSPPCSPTPLTGLDAAVELIARERGAHLVVAAPLGLGKPHRLLNALYEAANSDSARSLRIYTALSLAPPAAGKGLQRRFLAPFLARHFGADFPVLRYVEAQRADALPANIEVQEFYLQSGALLGSAQAQQSYSSLNYTHVARNVAGKDINVLVQKVAREPGGARLSLSCNPDLSFDLLDEIARLGKPRPLVVGEIDPELPFLGGSACVEPGFFDVVVDLPGAAPRLFALPRQPVSDADYAIGLYASALIRDGGTLQIGIGSLSDALCHALVLRHSRNAEYLQVLEALSPGYANSDLVRCTGGTAPFATGLYGASEMVNDGFMRLREAGILTRRVLDDLDAMQRLEAGTGTTADHDRLAREGRWLDGGFYLGSHALYAWLRGLPAAEAAGIGMTRISHINELYGGNEALERLQRKDSRFVNTCMMMTALGSAVSDGLEDGRVVSGVGGQYNFVAMAHALRDARSILAFRATRESGGAVQSSVPWSYGHCTIPRHLRDIAITEYGVADLRDANDAECVQRMLAICDLRFQPSLALSAKRARKLRDDYRAPPAAIRQDPASLRTALQAHRRAGLLPDYPLGSDFTPVEQRLVAALAWLKAASATRRGKASLVLRALAQRMPRDSEALERMSLTRPSTAREWIDARLLGLALARAADALR